MTAYELLDLLNRSAVALSVDGDRLRCRAPRGVLTPHLVEALRRHKVELIAILTGAAGGPVTRRADPAAPVPLSPAQRQLWVLDQLTPGNPVYNNPAAIDLTGRLDTAALARALTEIVRRHEGVRTAFPAVDGEPVQVVLPAEPVAVPVDDLRHLPPSRRADRCRERTDAAAREPFDLTRGPLLRTRLLRLTDEAHRWLLTVHHIVADGWSIGILIREFAVLYAAYLRGEPSPLPELPVQYADHVLWQRRRLGGGELDRQLAYWTAHLAGAPTLLELPTDRRRPVVQRHRGASHVTAVDAEVVRGLRATGSTLFMTLAAALSVLLWRYTGQRDVCVGTPFANRSHRDVEGLIGHFINTVVIRTRIEPDERFDTLLAAVRDTVLAAQAHPDLPFERLVEALRPERHTGHSPLFQVMLVLQNIPRGSLDLPDLTLRAAETDTGTAKFDLSVEVAEDAAGLSVRFEYSTDLFDAATVERLAGHFTRLLAQVAADPALRVRDLRMPDPAQRHTQVYEWNATNRAVQEPVALADRFAAQVRARPDATAVDAAGERIDYATLARRAHRLAHALIARGVRPDQVVGLHTGRTTDLAVGILAILAAGAAYLPLDPTQPPDRLTAMVADAAPALVLTDAAPGQDRWLRLADVAAEGTRDDPPGVTVRPAHLAYVIYTSGSTGRPKGVAVPHGAVANLLDAWVGRFGALPGEPAALWSSAGFDVSVQEILLPLTTGAALHIVPEDVRTDPEALFDWLRRHRIAQAYLPPAYVRWVDEAPAERLTGLALRQLLVGVEPLPEAALHRIASALPGLRILNGYGPTETTVYSTGYPDPRDLDRQCPIGRPLSNTRVYLLDEWDEPVPVGVTGEIHIGGAGVARGYLGRPGLTAAGFTPDPFVPGERVYRTGDLARYLPDGTIEFLGRRDAQVKLRGFRIETGEVEAALLGLPGVREAAVLVDRDAAGEPRLVAGVVRSPAAARPLAEWRAALSRRLPGYMMPAQVVELAHLPQNRNGKLDGAAVLRAARADARWQVNLASPRDHVELTLYQIWKRLLLHPAIGINDSFFDIGGTSISAIKLAHAVREAFGEPLPVRDIMLYPTIEALGGRLRRGAGGQPPSNLIEFRAGAGHERVVCVHPAGGTAFCYLALAKALPEDCGVYGIQSPGVNPGEDFLASIDAMAEAYLRLIAPLGTGPLVLTGLSYGGLVAYEMARRLTLAGRPDGVSVLLLDTLGTDDPAHRAAIEPVDLAEFRDKLIKFNGMYPGIDDRQIDQYHRIYNHNRMTMRDYLAPPAPVRLVLLQATAGRDEEFLAEVRGFWGRRAGGSGLHVEQVHCDHWEILESVEVQRVAGLLRAELDRLAAPARSRP